MVAIEDAMTRYGKASRLAMVVLPNMKEFRNKILKH